MLPIWPSPLLMLSASPRRSSPAIQCLWPPLGALVLASHNKPAAVLVFSTERRSHRPQMITALHHAIPSRPASSAVVSTVAASCWTVSDPMGKATPPANKLPPSLEKLSHSLAYHFRDNLLRDALQIPYRFPGPSRC